MIGNLNLTSCKLIKRSKKLAHSFTKWMQIEANSTKQEGAVGKGKGKRDIDWCFSFRKLVEIFCL